jgi:hypothetical protein
MVSYKLILMDPRITLGAFDGFLAERRLRLEAVVIGGTALNLLGVIDRATRDCDILHPPLPSEVVAASMAFAAEVRRSVSTRCTPPTATLRAVAYSQCEDDNIEARGA